MSRVRGKKRMEIIKKFLEGEEDPDYEVIPTVTEGKYFVRPRKGSKSKNKSQNGLSEPLRDKVPKLKQETKDEQSLDDIDDDIDDEAIERSKDHELRRSEEQKQNGLSEPLREERCSKGQSPNKVPKKKKEPKQQVVKKSEQVFYDPTISYQILEQLKLLGEEQRLKRTKKEQKKLVKHQIRKQLKQREQEQESSSSSEEYNYDVVEEEGSSIPGQNAQPKQLFKPTPLRRRVNLNK